MEEEEISADACTETAENVCQELCELNVDAEHVCALVVAADCVEITSELCPFEKTEEKDNYCKCNDYAHFNISRNIYAFFVYGTEERNGDFGSAQFDEGFVSYGDSVAAYYGGHTFCKEQSCQCDYERLEFEVSYEKSLYDTEGKADSQGDAHRSEYVAGDQTVIYFLEINGACHTYE